MTIMGALTFNNHSVLAKDGPMAGKPIECKGANLGDATAWPSGMWTPEGWFYRLEEDENGLPDHWAYDASRNTDGNR